MEQPLDQSEATDCLRALTNGDDTRHDRLLYLVYTDLRKQAAVYLSGENPGHTLQPTALVHEAWFRIIDQERVEWKNEGHFMAVAAQAMRRILVDHARRKKSAKRGGDRERFELKTDIAQVDDEMPEIEAIDRGLDQLGKWSERRAQIVELRFFAGLEMEQIGRILEVSQSSLKRDWRVARAWLQGFVERDLEIG